MAHWARLAAGPVLAAACTGSETAPVQPLERPVSTGETTANTCELIALAATVDPILRWLAGDPPSDLADRHERFVTALGALSVPSDVAASLATLAEINGRLVLVLAEDPVDEAALATLVEQRAEPPITETLARAETSCR